MILPKEIQHVLHDFLELKEDSCSPLSGESIGGGSINRAFRIRTPKGDFFLKYNSAQAYPNMFEAEFKGLQLLHGSQSLRIPKPLFYYEGQEYAFLLLEFIQEKARKEDFWKDFAANLAKLHRNTQTDFGLEYPNYMGSLVQTNTTHTDFTSFFIKERLVPQVRMAYDNKLLSKKHLQQFNTIYKELNAIFPDEKPALVHGDLWSGNFMSDDLGNAVILDPAVYYGHREVDIAMSTMFGGFSADFYAYYQQFWPMEKGWEVRLNYYLLYPILIHVNLFGSSYLNRLQNVLKNH